MPDLSAKTSMQGEATITFTQAEVEPPVYVVTSLSTPPWAPLELKPSKEKTSSGDYIFEQKFSNIAEGSYQYKIRIGEGHWVVDESKESATDEHGNRNNVVHVEPATSHAPLNPNANAKDTLDRKDSTIDTNDTSPAPVPFVVVEKVKDEAQPEYGDVQPKSLNVDESKRAADPEPDVEKTKTDSPLDVEPLLSAGEPDELEPPEAQAPLFRHESFQDSKDSLTEHAMDVIEEESAHSSTDLTSSGDIINTPSAESPDDLQENDVLEHGPRFTHETGPGAEETDEQDDILQGPLLPHETGFSSRADRGSNDSDEDEYDAAPLLPHETGFSSFKSGKAASRKNRLSKDDFNCDSKPEQYMRYNGRSHDGDGFGELSLAPTFSHEQISSLGEYSEPLLPHERGSAVESLSGSERSFSMSPTAYEAPAFRDVDTHRESFGGSRPHTFFRTRTSSSTLPNKLPHSDAEDTDLHDPGLEMFPVGREQILERVATIGNKLPEDETHGAPASPQPSVLSQACSSVDLVPVKSYLSLASVREDEEEEDEEDNADVESIGSPVTMSHPGARFAREKDPLATPHPDDSKQLGFVAGDNPKMHSTRPANSSEDSSVDRDDDSKDSSKGPRGLPDIVASKATVINTLTPPLTPRALEALDKQNSTPVSKSDLRQRRGVAEETGESATPKPQLLGNEGEHDLSANPAAVKAAVEKLAGEESSTQSWRGASIGVSTLVAAGAVFYYLSVLR